MRGLQALKTIYLLRKPLSEKTVTINCLCHGTGAYNIAAGRVAYAPGEVDFDKVERQQNSEGAIQGAFGASALIGTEIMTYKPEGRWPANLLLHHLPLCVQVGVKEEPGYTINRWDDGAKPFGNGAGHPFTSTDMAPITTPVWECAPGCPVKNLDNQDKKAVRCFKQFK